MRACDYNVYRIKYTNREQIRTASDASGDTDFVGWRYDVPRKYLCVAPTVELALAAFRRYHNDEWVKNVEPEIIGTCDDLVYLQ